MGPRVLCLHGMGTNSSNFASQTACFRDLLPASYEFFFANGLLSCEPAAEVIDVLPGPYLCWYTSPSTNRVKAAHAHLKQLAIDHGPFDIVMGFSQGAALAASWLLHQELEAAEGTRLFKAAIFICSPVPFSTSVQYGIDTREAFGVDASIPIPARPDCPHLVPDHLVTDPAYLNGEDETHNGQPAEKGSTFYQMFHDSVDECRISIPTLHIHGKEDKWRLHSNDLYRLCQKEVAECLVHGGGHEVPVTFAEEIADAIESLAYHME